MTPLLIRNNVDGSVTEKASGVLFSVTLNENVGSTGACVVWKLKSNCTAEN